MNKLFVLFSILFTNVVFSQSHAEPVTLEPGSKAIDFKLKGTDGKLCTLSSFNLQSKQAALNNNYIFESENKYDLIDNFDPNWSGEIPYTVIIEPGGKIVRSNSGGLNFLEFRKAIVENPLIGRYF